MKIGITICTLIVCNLVFGHLQSFASTNRMGVGIDMTFQNEPYFNSDMYNTLNDEPLYHIDIMPCLYYKLNEKITIGLLGGFGKVTRTKESQPVSLKAEFESKSMELGTYMKYCFFNIDKISGYIQPHLRYREVRQTNIISSTSIPYRSEINGGQNIISIDLNIRLGVNYSLISMIDINFFIGDNIISRELISPIISSSFPSVDWTSFTKLMLGVGVNYTF